MRLWQHASRPAARRRVAHITVEVCSQCHPFYTGKQKILDSGGRVARFEKRYGKRTKADARPTDATTS